MGIYLAIQTVLVHEAHAIEVPVAIAEWVRVVFLCHRRNKLEENMRGISPLGGLREMEHLP